MLKSAFFAVYVPRSTCLHGDTKLRVYCIPTSKRCEMIDCEEKQGNILIGNGSSVITMCSNEEASVFLSEGKKKGRLLVRWGNLFSNQKCYIFLGCDWFYRPCIFYSLAYYQVIGQFVIGESVIGQLDDQIWAGDLYGPLQRWADCKRPYRSDASVVVAKWNNGKDLYQELMNTN